MNLVKLENAILFAVALCIIAIFGVALFPSIVTGY
jgi:hypothetical protein